MVKNCIRTKLDALRLVVFVNVLLDSSPGTTIGTMGKKNLSAKLIVTA